jgi:hypothetical protein
MSSTRSFTLRLRSPHAVTWVISTTMASADWMVESVDASIGDGSIALMTGARAAGRGNLAGTPFVPTPSPGHGKRRSYRQGVAQRSSPLAGLTA